ncbi:ATP-dependent zinc metalloprotease FtsH [bacterium]|nr:ATP-dependent zinc metalloprotease FtsH [bacterium]
MDKNQRRTDRGQPPRGDRGQRSPQDGTGGPGWRRASRTFLFWVLLLLFSITIFQFFNRSRRQEVTITYSEFRQQLYEDNVSQIFIVDQDIHGELKSVITKLDDDKVREFNKFYVYIPFDVSELRTELEAKDVTITGEQRKVNWFNLLLGVLPWILLFGIWMLIFRQMQGGPKGIFSFGKSKAKLLTQDKPKVTFADVAGADEAKQDLQEVIEFLKDPGRFQKLGGRIPKGALLLGAPGTGKTLLARAVAGEADVPFFSMSGSDFVEMFVGVGASRVRDLFEQGKKNAPCIIFIDEIDAVGRQRGAGLGGGHDEREQTLNQLLVEMDGFESNEGVILLAATNRPDVLDPALLRPGRFDRQIIVDNPDVRGREGILKVHTRRIPLAKDVDLTILARGTPGLSGADLANLVNEAALLAARRDRDKVTMIDFEEAKDRVMMGVERKSLILSEDEKRSTAYHEAGHALVAKLIPEAEPVHKVTIIPRGRSLGVTHLLPRDEKHSWSKEYLENLIAVKLGGRVAEKIVFSQLTTGAGGDIEDATNWARSMVCEWGMSERLGPVTFGKKEAEIFLGREIAKHRDYSEETAILIDEEVKRIVEAQERRAEAILRANVDKLHRLAKALLKREILDSFEIDEILRTKRPRPRYPRRKPHRREKETPRQGAPEGRRPLPKTSGTERKQKVWIRPKSRPQSKDS